MLDYRSISRIPPLYVLLTWVVLCLSLTRADFNSTIKGNQIVFTSKYRHETYLWQFGDGTSSEVGPEVGHYYPKQAYYGITFTGRNVSSNKVVRSSKNVLAPVNRLPEATFSHQIDKYNVTLNASNSFDEDGLITNYAWNFGDGSGVTNVTTSVLKHVYDSNSGPKDYLVRLSVVDNSGATDIKESFVQISAPPVILFYYISVGNGVFLNAQLSIARNSILTTFEWDFGDGTLPTITNEPYITHYYPYSNKWLLTLTVTDKNSQSSSKQSTVTSPVNILPIANFSISKQNEKEVIFDGSKSFDKDGSVSQYTWNFGDGNLTLVIVGNGSKTQISHIFPDAGVYEISLVVQDNSGANSTAVTAQVLIKLPPRADFRVLQTINDTVWLDASFDTVVPNGGDLKLISWNFGDNKWENHTISWNVSHTYQRAGHYNITLFVIDRYDMNDTITKTVFVNTIPEAKLQVQLDEADSNGILIIADGAKSQDRDGELKNFCWIFGREEDLKSSLEKKEEEGNNQTDPYLSMTTPTQAMNSGIFFNISTEQEVTLPVEDLSTNCTIASSTKFRIHRGGQYRTCLQVLDNYASKSSLKCVSFFVDKAPIPVFSVSSKLGEKRIFLDASGSYDMDGEITELLWDFGDGRQEVLILNDSSSSLMSANYHEFVSVGNYTISLRVKDNCGMISPQQFSQTVLIAIPPLVSWLVAENLNDTITLDASASTAPNGYFAHVRWDFGDTEIAWFNYTAADGNAGKKLGLFNHTYIRSGTYEISLFIEDNFGFTDTLKCLIYVNMEPHAAFDLISNVNNTVTLDASRSIDHDDQIKEYHWYFGDEEDENVTNHLVISNNNQSPTGNITIVRHTYKRGGFYNITLQVKDEHLAFSSISSLFVFVNTPPKANFSVTAIIDTWVVVNAEGNLFLSSYSWTSQSFSTLDPDGYVKSLTWNFGDNTPNITNLTSSVQLHKYRASGNFTITMFATDNLDVTSLAAQQQISLNSPPTAHFQIIPTPLLSTISLDASTSFDPDSNGFISSYCWVISQPGASPAEIPEYLDTTTPVQYTCVNQSLVAECALIQSGYYNISLTVIDNLGAAAINLATLTTFMNEFPVAGFYVKENKGTGELILETNSSICADLDGGYITSYTWIWGDGASTKLSPPPTSDAVVRGQHIYRTQGFYQVGLTVTDNFNASADIFFEIYVSLDPEVAFPDSLDPESPDFLKVKDEVLESTSIGLAPICDFYFWIIEMSPDRVRVNFSAANSYDPDGKLQQYIWDFDDETENVKTASSYMLHEYYGGGTYSISLTCVDDSGMHSLVRDMLHLNYAPIPIFATSPQLQTSPAGSDINNTITFDGSNSYDPDGYIVKVIWDFGDSGNLIVSNNITDLKHSHTFNESGNYKIRLTVTDNYGWNRSFAQTVRVPLQELVVAFEENLPELALIVNTLSRKILSFSSDDFGFSSRIYLSDQVMYPPPASVYLSDPNPVEVTQPEPTEPLDLYANQEISFSEEEQQASLSSSPQFRNSSLIRLLKMPNLTISTSEQQQLQGTNFLIQLAGSSSYLSIDDETRLKLTSQAKASLWTFKEHLNHYYEILSSIHSLRLAYQSDTDELLLVTTDNSGAAAVLQENALWKIIQQDLLK